MSATTSRPPTEAHRLRVRPFNTLFGLLFLSAAGAWAAHDQAMLDGDEIGRVVAVGLIVLGVLGLVATLALGRRGRAPQVPPVDATTASYDDSDDSAPGRRD